MSNVPSPLRFQELHNCGFTVIPLQPRTKMPVSSWKEYQTRTNTKEEIEMWAATDYNVGVVAGRISGIAVLDADSPEAIELLEAAGLPATPWVNTSKGRHYYFKMPDVHLGNRVRVNGVPLDVRAEGGFVVAPGSVHPDGSLYEWGLSPDEADFAPFPLHLVPPVTAGRGLLRKTGASALEQKVSPAIAAFLTEQLERACDLVANAEDGCRNSTLYQQAKDMAKHVSAVGCDWEPYAAALGAAADEAGADGIAGTLNSAWTGGSETPTDWLIALRDHVYLAAQDRFYHPRARKYFTRSGFSSAYAHSFHEKGGLANFAINTGSIINVADVTYDPRAEPGVVEVDGLPMLNVYQPSQIVAEDGDAAPFVEFIEYLVPDAAEREHLLKVMAHTVRYPGARVRHAVLLRSTAHGIGKSMLSGIWGELVGKSNVRKTTTGEIVGAFDSWAIMNTLNVIEELDHKSGLSMYNRLKDFITSDTATINEKHLQPRNWPLFSTFLMLSNRTAPLLIEECDRRLMVIDSHAVPREPAYYTRLAAWLADNAGVVRHYLDQIDLAAFNPHAPPPMTAAKSALIGRSKSVLSQDIGYLIHDREANLGRDIVTLHDVRFALVGAAGKSDRELGKALTELGAVRFGQVGTGSARKSLWGIRHRKYWEAASPQELLDESSRHEGMLPDMGMPDDFYRHHLTWPGLRSFLEDWALCAPRKDPV